MKNVQIQSKVINRKKMKWLVVRICRLKNQKWIWMNYLRKERNQIVLERNLVWTMLLNSLRDVASLQSIGQKRCHNWIKQDRNYTTRKIVQSRVTSVIQIRCYHLYSKVIMIFSHRQVLMTHFLLHLDKIWEEPNKLCPLLRKRNIIGK